VSGDVTLQIATHVVACDRPLDRYAAWIDDLNGVRLLPFAARVRRSADTPFLYNFPLERGADIVDLAPVGTRSIALNWVRRCFMSPRPHTFIVAAALALSHWHSSAVMAQVASFSHGAVEGGRVITDSSKIQINPSNAHAELPSSALTIVLQPDDSDLFVLEFDAECFMTGFAEDRLSVQARLNGLVGWAVLGGLGPSFLQPQDNPPDLAVCKVGTSPIRHRIQELGDQTI
jgi:hypothetical protein